MEDMAERAASNWLGHSKVASRVLDRIDGMEIRSISTEVRQALREAYMAGVRYQRKVNIKETPWPGSID